MLDLKNKKLLAELEMNAKINHSALAKKLKLSKQVVKYRIEKLEKEKIIQGYNAIIDLNQLGETIHIIYLKLFKISSSAEKQWIREIEKNKNVLAVGKNAGEWDLTIVLRAKNNQELDLILKKITFKKTDKIKKKLITSEIESTYFPMQFIHKNKNPEFSTVNSHKNTELKEEDLKIVNLLSENCRISLLDLSEKIKMSPSGTKQKIKRLEQNKIIIGYKTKINYEKLGFLHFRVFLHLKEFSDEHYKTTKQFLKSQGNIESISRCMGHADIDFRCYTKNIFKLYSLISKVKDKFLNNIIEVNSMSIFGWERIGYLK